MSDKLPHTFVEHMDNAGLSDSTQDTYTRTVERVARAKLDPVQWLRSKMSSRTPMGTVLPLRAAVKQFLLSQGYSTEDVEALLPKARGLQTATREALTPAQLAVFYLCVEDLNDPVRCILSLLPRTGLRISEITSLKMGSIVKRGAIYGFQFTGKGNKVRFVPLSKPARIELKRYLKLRGKSGGYLFPGNKGVGITPEAVRKVCRQMRKEHEELGPLSPHVLRHTFATALLRKNVDVKKVQTLLGHKNIETTLRYQHPDAEMLSEAVEGLD